MLGALLGFRPDNMKAYAAIGGGFTLHNDEPRVPERGAEGASGDGLTAQTAGGRQRP